MCDEITVEQIYGAPLETPSGQICIQGTARYLGGRTYLTSPNYNDENFHQMNIELHDANEAIRYGDVLTGDTVQVRGIFNVPEDCYRAYLEHGHDKADSRPDCEFDTAMQMFVLDLTVLNREASERHCLPVEMNDLYTDPLLFNEQVICTEGHIYRAENPWPHDLWWFGPEGYSEPEAIRFSIHLAVNEGPNLLERGIRPGDRLAIRGRFILSENCYRQEMLNQMLPDGQEAFCWPVAAPMDILYPEIEVVH